MQKNLAISDRLEVKVERSINKPPHIPGYICFFVRVNLSETMQKTCIYKRIV
jgi:hypothetical protein